MTTPQDPLEPENATRRDWIRSEHEPGLVSVIIPTYNRAHFLVEAMDSVWNQTYRPIELIVVADGSTDNTAERVRQWGRDRAGDAQGAPAARNASSAWSKNCSTTPCGPNATRPSPSHRPKYSKPTGR